MNGVGIVADSAVVAVVDVVGLVVVVVVVGDRGGHHCHWTGNSSTFY